MYQALTGALPFAAKGEEMLCRMILFDEPYYPRYLSPEAAGFIKVRKRVKSTLRCQSSDSP